MFKGRSGTDAQISLYQPALLVSEAFGLDVLYIISLRTPYQICLHFDLGALVKSRKDIYRLLNDIPFDAVLNGLEPVTEPEFAAWHQTVTSALCKSDSRLCVGWAAKLLNVYLKTAGYVGNLGRSGLLEVLRRPVELASQPVL